jgi:hypothetical protein
MGQHVFPGIDLEQVALRRFRMRAVEFGPGQPPVIGAAFLLAADIAIESLS